MTRYRDHQTTPSRRDELRPALVAFLVRCLEYAEIARCRSNQEAEHPPARASHGSLSDDGA